MECRGLGTNQCHISTTSYSHILDIAFRLQCKLLGYKFSLSTNRIAQFQSFFVLGTKYKSIDQGGFTSRSTLQKWGSKSPLREPHFILKTKTQAQRSVPQTRRKFLFSRDCQNLVGNWCHIRATPFFNIMIEILMYTPLGVKLLLSTNNIAQSWSSF